VEGEAEAPSEATELPLVSPKRLSMSGMERKAGAQASIFLMRGKRLLRFLRAASIVAKNVPVGSNACGVVAFARDCYLVLSPRVLFAH
jgi:hypothetical protein